MIIRKSRCAEYVGRIQNRTRKREGKRAFGRLRRSWKDNIKLAQQRIQWRCLVNMAMKF